MEIYKLESSWVILGDRFSFTYFHTAYKKRRKGTIRWQLQVYRRGGFLYVSKVVGKLFPKSYFSPIFDFNDNDND